MCRSLRLAIVISTGRRKGELCSGGIVGGGERDGLHSCESERVSQLFLFFFYPWCLLVSGFGAWGLVDSASRWAMWCSFTGAQ